MKFINREFFRYLLVGGSNTVLTYAAYVLLLPLMPYTIAYTITYVAGIIYSYVMSSLFVFRQPLEWRKALEFPLVYVVQYGLGIGFTALLVEVLRIDEKLAPAIVIALTIPVTFVLSRFILKRDNRTEVRGLRTEEKTELSRPIH